ncbi:pirin family protein [Microlunatus aurantiacus]|uniref:pirin family protein n=1 Tax=Microlunatus aurantiacus TaxID=446786 RepID=UPI0031D58BDC
MSVREAKPQEYVCRSSLPTGPEELLLAARKVWLGKTTEVARVLPDRAIRMIGAWCFLDHYGPEDVSDAPGMQVPAHPHTGLQTVSWLVAGEIEHRDSLGTRAMVTPGTLNIMTAGHGIVHSEMSLPDKPPQLHGLQLWVALPDAVRDDAPRFDRYTDLPVLERPGVRGQVLIGEVDGVASPAISFSPLVGADLTLEPGASVDLGVDADHEHGVFVVSGEVTTGTTAATTDQLVYLGTGRDAVTLTAGGDGARVLLLGGEPFAEEIVMWWNFIGRTHEEVTAFREQWQHRGADAEGGRFRPVVAPGERVMEAPTMPTVALKPRPRRAPEGGR